MTAPKHAPAAFFIGQASAAEQDSVVRLSSTVFKRRPTAAAFRTIIRQQLFPNYGIPLDKEHQGLQPRTRRPRSRAIWTHNGCSSAADWTPNGPVVNGGDYYIVEATNPVTTTVNVPGQPSAASCLSVYTPTIPPGFTDPAHAVNPNPGEQSCSRKRSAVTHGNLGTPADIGTAANGSRIPISATALPIASLVSTRANGTYSMNYRNEPVQLRVKPTGNRGQQTDLAFAFSSDQQGRSAVERATRQRTIPSASALAQIPTSFPHR